MSEGKIDVHFQLIMNLFILILGFCAHDTAAIQVSSSSTTPHCLQDYSHNPYLTLNQSLREEYGKFLRPLGSGASSSVHLVKCYSDNATVAVKRFAAMPSSLSTSRKQVLERCIKLEYQIGTLLNGHRGIAETIELVYEPGSSTWSIILEHHGLGLAEERRYINTQERLSIFYQLLETLEHIHLRGIAYGDVKIENVLLTAEKKPKIIDFGSSTFAGCQVETPGVASTVIPGDSGTPPYMPPEVFTVLEYDRQKADVWSLGVLLYVTIVGKIPWRTASLSDERFRSFIGLDVMYDEENQTCQAPAFDQVSDFVLPSCSKGILDLLHMLPRSTRALVGQLLELDPILRPDLSTVLKEFSFQDFVFG
jgi:serine/threonine protein kinase